MDSQEHEHALRRLGLRNADGFAERWAGYGIRPQEMLAWISSGVAVDEPHIAAALAAAEWAPEDASRMIASGDRITLVQAVRQHPNAANYARELRRLAG